jgi:hypothetical protein
MNPSVTSVKSVICHCSHYSHAPVFLRWITDFTDIPRTPVQWPQWRITDFTDRTDETMTKKPDRTGALRLLLTARSPTDDPIGIDAKGTPQGPPCAGHSRREVSLLHDPSKGVIE